MRVLALAFVMALADVASFSLKNTKTTATRLFENETNENAAVSLGSSATNSIRFPASYSEMCKEVAAAMRDAVEQKNINRQIVRVLLPRDSSNAQLGVLSEGILDVDSQSIMLVPPDESWQGGIMQLYYSAAPTCKDVLRLFTRDTSGVPPRIVEDRTVDESGVDGVGLLKAELGEENVNIYVQPSQETIDYVEAVAKKTSGLIVLCNPQWRLTDDVFDKTSKDGGFLGKLAGFLGGKGGTLKRLDEMGFESVYNLEGYVCRGYNVRLVRRFDSDYVVFCEDDNKYNRVGTKSQRPTYQDVEKMLMDGGYGFKYAQDIGI